MKIQDILDQYFRKISWRTVLIIGIGLLVLILMIVYIYRQSVKSKAAGETINLAFNPASVTVKKGDNFSSTVNASPSADMSIRGYAFSINFDKTKVTVTDISYKLGAVSAGLGNDNSNLKTVNDNGVIKIQGELQTSTGQAITTSTATDVVTVKFTANTADSSGISVDSSTVKFYKISADYSLSEIPTGQTTDLSINGGTASGTPTQSTNGTVTPTQAATGSAVLNLKLKFQGILSKPKTATMSVRIKLGGVALPKPTDYQTGTFTSDDNGVWSGTVGFDVAPGPGYIVYVKGPKQIQKKVCDATPTETSPGTYHCASGKITIAKGDNNLDFSGILQLAGDLPEQDGVVNSYDISLVRNNLGKTDDEALRLADVNLDGIVDTQDYSLIIAALSVRGDEE